MVYLSQLASPRPATRTVAGGANEKRLYMTWRGGSRKQADLEMEDRIELYLGTDSEILKQALAAHKDYIAAETLVKKWSETPLTGEHFENKVKVEGQELVIQVRKTS